MIELIAKKYKYQKKFIFYKILFCLLLREDNTQIVFSNLILVLLKFSLRNSLLNIY